VVRCFAILALAVLQQAAVRAPRIEIRGTEATLILPPSMARALRAFDPDFTPRKLTDYPEWVWKKRKCSPRSACEKEQVNSRQALFAVIGDFNGDGILDVIVDGDNKNYGRRLAIMSSRNGFKVTQIEVSAHISISREVAAAARELGNPNEGLYSGMYLVTKKTLRSGHESKPLVLAADAYEVVFWEKAAVVRYYRGGTWHDYTTSD